MAEVIAGYEVCPSYATLYGYIGACACMVLACWGAAWGTWRAGLGICVMGVDHPSGIIKNIVPIVMAGVLGIYGLIVAVIITQGISPPKEDGNTYSLYNGYTDLAAGLCCGFSCLAAGGTIGVLGDSGVRGLGLKAERGKKFYHEDEGDIDDGAMVGGSMADAVDGANKLFVGLLIMLIFSEAIGLYGLIVALILSQKTYSCL